MEPITYLHKFFYDVQRDADVFISLRVGNIYEAVILTTYTPASAAHEDLSAGDTVEYCEGSDEILLLQPIVAPAAFTQTLDILTSHCPELELYLDEYGCNEIHFCEADIKLDDVWLIVEALENERGNKESLWLQKEQLEVALAEVNKQLGI